MSEIQHELRPLVTKLRARYPQVKIVAAEICNSVSDGVRQQIITYRASIAALNQSGLLTDEMLGLMTRRPKWRPTSLGDGFLLFDRSAGSVNGLFDLAIYTAEVPRERLLKVMPEAKRVLKKIARAVATR